MTSKALLSFVVVTGTFLGFAGEAGAVAPCAQVCGPSSPCLLRCYLPGPFVTTCGEVGPCIDFSLAPSNPFEDEVQATSCEFDTGLTYSMFENEIRPVQ